MSFMYAAYDRSPSCLYGYGVLNYGYGVLRVERG